MGVGAAVFQQLRPSPSLLTMSNKWSGSAVRGGGWGWVGGLTVSSEGGTEGQGLTDSLKLSVFE